MQIDFEYLCRVTSDLSGIPVRAYRKGSLLCFHSPVRLSHDPMLPYQEDLFSIHEHVGYFLTEQFYYYGVLTSGDLQLIIGPTRQIPASDQELRELAFRAKLGKEDAEDFIRSMKAIVCMPVESLLLMLCSINYMVNGEKLELQDLTITTQEQTGFAAVRSPRNAGESNGQVPMQPHNSYGHEQVILEIVRKGDTAALRNWLGQAPAVRSGVLAPEHLRQSKNLFIVTATLVSRAAVRGGLDVDDAFSLSDFYIQNCEQLNEAEKITNLQYHMVLDFTEKVERLHLAGQSGKLSSAVANYIQHHLSVPISTEQIAKSLYMGRSYLSTKFHKETGIKLNDFILQQKTEEAKRLLRYTDRSIAAIGEHLAFSSSAHFTRVFKKYAGTTPVDYRIKTNE